jgi:hypothetical protein
MMACQLEWRSFFGTTHGGKPIPKTSPSKVEQNGLPHSKRRRREIIPHTYL